jgi:prepilin-type N-terminal cleavage/methylation domain-containing protein
MKVQSSRAQIGFTLIEIMIVVSIIGLLLAIAIPNFLHARETSRAKACISNLRQIDTAKQQYMLDKNTSSFTSANSGDTTLGGLAPLYIRYAPTCPLSGTYTTGDGTTDPVCSLSTSDPANYGATGLYPHYLP